MKGWFFTGLSIVLSLLMGAGWGYLFSQDSNLNAKNTKKLDSGNESLQNYYDLSNENLRSNPLKSKLLALEGLQIATKTKDPAMQAKFYRLIGASYTMLGNYDSSWFFLERAKKMSVTLNDKNTRALVNLSLGTLYVRQMNYEEAMTVLMQALEHFENAGDKQNLLKTYGNIAALYMYQHNFDQAEKYYLNAEKISHVLNDHSGLGQSYSGLSTIYGLKNSFDTALDYALKSAYEFRLADEKAFESVAFKEAASIYLAKGNPEKARELASKSYLVAAATGLSRYVANSLSVLAKISYQCKNYTESIEKSLVSLATDSTDSETKTDNLINLMKCYIAIGKPEIATGYFDRYKKELDLQVTDKNRRAISEMEVKYETEKKELQIKALEERKKMYLAATISAVLLLLLVVTVLIYRAKNISSKKKIAEQKIIQLEKEQQLIAAHSLLAGEELERTRLATELHDGLGSLLTGVKLNLSAIKGKANVNNEILSSFNHAFYLLNNAIAEMRRVAHNLMPETLVHYGLKTAINDFIEKVEPDGLPVLRFSAFGDDLRYGKELEITVYRITQELVNNALKHAQAKNIDVQLFTEKNRVCVKVIDNGKGFNLSESEQKENGKGLKNIGERVTAFNGRMEIVSEPGNGTECTMEFLIS